MPKCKICGLTYTMGKEPHTCAVCEKERKEWPDNPYADEYFVNDGKGGTWQTNWDHYVWNRCSKACKKVAKEREAEYINMLEDVVNELDLSDNAITEHGPFGTRPAELVRLVLAEKNSIIWMLKKGFKELKENNHEST